MLNCKLYEIQISSFLASVRLHLPSLSLAFLTIISLLLWFKSVKVAPRSKCEKPLLFKSVCVWQILKRFCRSHPPEKLYISANQNHFPFCLHYLLCIESVNVTKTKFDFSLILRLYWGLSRGRRAWKGRIKNPRLNPFPWFFFFRCYSPNS